MCHRQTPYSTQNSEEPSKLPEVSWLEEFKPPVLFNDLATIGDHMNVTNVWVTHGLTGAGQIIGHADTGLDLGDTNLIHPDFVGKIVYAPRSRQGISGS